MYFLSIKNLGRIIFYSFAITIFFTSNICHAQQTKAGNPYWTDHVTEGKFSSAREACISQWNWAGMNNGYSRFIGAQQVTGNLANCSWTSFQYLCPQETGQGGLGPCDTVLPSTAELRCDGDYYSRRGDRCLLQSEYVAEEKACSRDFGGNINPVVGDPIILSSGSFLEKAVDYATADGRLSISRVYRSNLLSSPMFGEPNGFRFNFMKELKIDSSSQKVSLYTEDGFFYKYILKNGVFVEDTSSGNSHYEYTISFIGTLPSDWGNSSNSTMTISSHQWKVTDSNDRTWIMTTYNTDSSTPGNYNVAHPISETSRDGYALTLAYGSTNELISITDSFGKILDIIWRPYNVTSTPNVPGALPSADVVSEINLPGGGKLRYSYDPPIANPSTSRAQRLTKFERLDPAGNIIMTTTYQYEDTRFPIFPTSITDARNIRIASFSYDSAGRAAQSNGPNGAYKTSVSYSRTATLTATVTNPLGKIASFNFEHNSAEGRTKLKSVEGKASTNCTAGNIGYGYSTSDASSSYQPNILINSETDEEGRKTTYVRDARGRPTSITRGAP